MTRFSSAETSENYELHLLLKFSGMFMHYREKALDINRLAIKHFDDDDMANLEFYCIQLSCLLIHLKKDWTDLTDTRFARDYFETLQFIQEVENKIVNIKSLFSLKNQLDNVSQFPDEMVAKVEQNCHNYAYLQYCLNQLYLQAETISQGIATLSFYYICHDVSFSAHFFKETVEMLRNKYQIQLDRIRLLAQDIERLSRFSIEQTFPDVENDNYHLKRK